MSIWSRVRSLEMGSAHYDKMLEIYHQRLNDSEAAVRELKGMLARHQITDERKADHRGNRVERRRRF